MIISPATNLIASQQVLDLTASASTPLAALVGVAVVAFAVVLAGTRSRRRRRRLRLVARSAVAGRPMTSAA